MGAALRLDHAEEAQTASVARHRYTTSDLCTGQINSASAPVVNLADERETRRRAFEELLSSHGAVTLIAEAWGVSRTIVYRVRDGEAPLSDKRIEKLPDALRGRFGFLHRLEARRRAHRLPVQLTLAVEP